MAQIKNISKPKKATKITIMEKAPEPGKIDECGNPYDHWDGFPVTNLTKWCKDTFGDEWDKARNAFNRGYEYGGYRLYKTIDK